MALGVTQQVNTEVSRRVSPSDILSFCNYSSVLRLMVSLNISPTGTKILFSYSHISGIRHHSSKEKYVIWDNRLSYRKRHTYIDNMEKCKTVLYSWPTISTDINPLTIINTLTQKGYLPSYTRNLWIFSKLYKVYQIFGSQKNIDV